MVVHNLKRFLKALRVIEVKDGFCSVLVFRGKLVCNGVESDIC